MKNNKIIYKQKQQFFFPILFIFSKTEFSCQIEPIQR